jgi:predicted bacteriocin transport accessory protein
MKKRSLLIVLAAVLLFSLSGCGNEIYDDNPPSGGEVVIRGNKGDIYALSPIDVIAKFDNQESFVLYAGTSDCDSCKEYKVTLQKLIDNYDIRIYYVPTPGDADDPETTKMINEYLFKLNWMPTTYIVQNGHAVSVREKTITYTELVTWLQSYACL